MQLKAYEGFLEHGRFYPLTRTVRKQGKVRAILTILDNKPSEISEPDRAFRDDWLKRLEASVDLAQDEVFPLLERSQVMREPVQAVQEEAL